MFFEWLGDEPTERVMKDGLNEVLDENDAGENIIVTSVVTDLELVPEKLELKKEGAVEIYNALFDSVRFHSVEISKNILTLAREIRDYYYIAADEYGRGGKMMDLGDAIHLATAIIMGCEEFHTRDMNSKGAKVPLVGLGVGNGVCGKYKLNIVSPIANQGALDV